MSRIAVIGAGFSGLSAAAYLSYAGHQVEVYEKNDRPGGRARQFTTDGGYTFDMGPSWYWMPDVFERFFEDFGHKVADFYRLSLLDPSFEIVFAGHELMRVPDNFLQLCQLFDSIEPGSGNRLEKFMTEAQYKYEKGIKNLVTMPGLSIAEFADFDLLKGIFRLQLFSSFRKHVRHYFTHPKLRALMEFPVLFLGATPDDTPALYSLMNYAGLQLGTWYPQGGFGKVINTIKQLAETNGTHFHFNSPVQQIVVEKGQTTGIVVGGRQIAYDAVLASADYHHVEKELLASSYRNYDESYWENRTFAPSCLIYYLGLDKKVDCLEHHTLFFDESLEQHANEIYVNAQWPSRPLFYVCCTSRTDITVAPPGHENLFLLMPLASGLEDNEALREKYFGVMIDRLEQHAGEAILANIDFKRSYCVNDFMADYNSYKGNAYGLANTLRQTAVLKPKMRNKKVRNLFYAGQLTVPGPGVPPALISGKIAADQILKYLKRTRNEVAVR